jgi:hypothetical protein
MDPALLGTFSALRNTDFLARIRQTLPGTSTQAFADQPSFSPQALLTLDAESAPRRVGAAVGGFVLAMVLTALIAKKRG